MSFFKTSSFFPFALLLSAVLLIQACGNDDNNGPTGPDFSNVPDGYDLSQADTTYTKEGGVEIYVIKKGEGPFEVITRDQIGLKYTGRIFEEETIFESTYASENNQSAIITNLTSIATSQQAAQIEGFRRGLLGMKIGEKRVVVVPPSLGYDDDRPGINGFDLRGKSLRYDVELTGIQ